MLKYQQSLNRTFRALADPSRRAILERLARARASVSELAEPLAMSLPAVHQHLQILEEAGLMSWEKKGRVRWCSIEPKRLSAAEEWIVDRRTVWNRRLDALGKYLADEERDQRRRKT